MRRRARLTATTDAVRARELEACPALAVGLVTAETTGRDAVRHQPQYAVLREPSIGQIRSGAVGQAYGHLLHVGFAASRMSQAPNLAIYMYIGDRSRRAQELPALLLCYVVHVQLLLYLYSMATVATVY